MNIQKLHYMTKNIIYLLFLICPFSPIFAQVGINIIPQTGAVLHIDAKANNSTDPVTTAYLDDVVVNSSGMIGVGTNNPQAKLDIKTTVPGSAFRLVDGKQAEGKVLTSDNNGVASWAYPVNSVFWIRSQDNFDGIHPPYVSNNGSYSGKSLTLTKGMWLVRYSLNWNFNIVNTGIGYLDVFLARNSTGTVPSIIDGTWVIAPLFKNASYTSTQNTIMYTVTAASETLYMWTYHNTTQHTTLISYGGNNTLEAIRWE